MVQPLEDTKLARDETRRSEQHEDVKETLRAEVNRAVIAEARTEIADERAGEIATVGRELERRAVREVASSEREVVRGRASARAVQIIDYVFGVAYVLIVIEIVLEAAGASDRNGFKNVMDTITTPLLAPFRGLFSDPAIGQYRFMFSYLAALVVWILVHLGIRGLIRVVGQRKTTF